MAGPRMKGSRQNRTNIIKVHSVSLKDKLAKKMPNRKEKYEDYFLCNIVQHVQNITIRFSFKGHS